MTPAMKIAMKIDFVSDVSCPWCVIGLKALEAAMARIGSELAVELHFQPFELNPAMPPEGEDIGQHIAKKYGLAPEAVAQNRERIRATGEALGFTFQMSARGRIYNTFDAHRLLHWAALEGTGHALRLKHRLFQAYFTDGEDPSSADVLLKAAIDAGLNGETAKTVLASDAYADAVREREDFYRHQGINGVPAIIINDRHLIQGGQPVDYFEQALRQLASADQAAA